MTLTAAVDVTAPRQKSTRARERESLETLSWPPSSGYMTLGQVVRIDKKTWEACQTLRHHHERAVKIGWWFGPVAAALWAFALIFGFEPGTWMYRWAPIAGCVGGLVFIGFAVTQGMVKRNVDGWKQDECLRLVREATGMGLGQLEEIVVLKEGEIYEGRPLQDWQAFLAYNDQKLDI
jgi:hypothetical protein